MDVGYFNSQELDKAPPCVPDYMKPPAGIIHIEQEVTNRGSRMYLYGFAEGIFVMKTRLRSFCLVFLSAFEHYSLPRFSYLPYSLFYLLRTQLQHLFWLHHHDEAIDLVLVPSEPRSLLPNGASLHGSLREYFMDVEIN